MSSSSASVWLDAPKIEECSVSLGGETRVLDEEGGDQSGEVGGRVCVYGREVDAVGVGNAVRTCVVGRVGAGEWPATGCCTMDKSEGNV